MEEFKYVRSVGLDTYYLLKRVIFVADLIFQVFYLLFLTYKVALQQGIFVTNVILLSLSTVSFVHHLVTRKEFYTQRQKQYRERFKMVIKCVKRVVNLVVIVYAVAGLVNNAKADNVSVLMTLLMIVGFLFSILCDVVNSFIDKRWKLLVNSIKMDSDNLLQNHPKIAFTLNALTKGSFANVNLSVDNEMLKKIKDVNHRIEMKDRRKQHFRLKNKDKM